MCCQAANSSVRWIGFCYWALTMEVESVAFRLDVRTRNISTARGESHTWAALEEPTLVSG